MGIPLATTTISVLRPTQADIDAEPYGDDSEGSRIVVVTDVRAVIWAPGSERQRKKVAGGEEALIKARLTCDPIDLRIIDWVKDLTTQEIWKVDSFVQRVALGLDHTQAELYLFKGLV